MGLALKGLTYYWLHGAILVSNLQKSQVPAEIPSIKINKSPPLHIHLEEKGLQLKIANKSQISYTKNWISLESLASQQWVWYEFYNRWYDNLLKFESVRTSLKNWDSIRPLKTITLFRKQGIVGHYRTLGFSTFLFLRLSPYPNHDLLCSTKLLHEVLFKQKNNMLTQTLFWLYEINLKEILEIFICLDLTMALTYC